MCVETMLNIDMPRELKGVRTMLNTSIEVCTSRVRVNAISVSFAYR